MIMMKILDKTLALLSPATYSSAFCQNLQNEILKTTFL